MQIHGTFRKIHFLRSNLRQLRLDILFPQTLPYIRVFDYLFCYTCRFWLIHPLHHHILLDLGCILVREQRQVVEGLICRKGVYCSHKYSLILSAIPLSVDDLVQKKQLEYRQKLSANSLKSLLLRSCINFGSLLWVVFHLLLGTDLNYQSIIFRGISCI